MKLLDEEYLIAVIYGYNEYKYNSTRGYQNTILPITNFMFCYFFTNMGNIYRYNASYCPSEILKWIPTDILMNKFYIDLVIAQCKTIQDLLSKRVGIPERVNQSNYIDNNFIDDYIKQIFEHISESVKKY